MPHPRRSQRTDRHLFGGRPTCGRMHPGRRGSRPVVTSLQACSASRRSITKNSATQKSTWQQASRPAFSSSRSSATRVTYWLDWGTLLGAWRNGSIIPWDDDGDVGILGGEPLRRVARHAHGFHFRCHECLFIIRYNFTADDIPFLFIDRQTGVYIDIFQYLDTGTVLTNEALPTYSLNTQPRDRVLPTTPCTLERRTYHCPRQPKEYLLKIYNGDLAIPWRYRFDVDPTESVQESDGSSARGVADM
eukprot:GGOE01023238.1.p2 GENE.GGOE01023238.1~~GGOE01023238.1.p2  ORF type:complete len:247 (-),score=15.56 GGOE01023238.1:475-1215(-)